MHRNRLFTPMAWHDGGKPEHRRAQGTSGAEHTRRKKHRSSCILNDLCQSPLATTRASTGWGSRAPHYGSGLTISPLPVTSRHGQDSGSFLFVRMFVPSTVRRSVHGRKRPALFKDTRTRSRADSEPSSPSHRCDC